MAFVQIIEMHTSNFEELQALSDGFFAATEGKRTLQRSVVTRDRNDPARFLILAFFDSYDAAMQNSNLPETAACRREADATAGWAPDLLRPRRHRRPNLRSTTWPRATTPS